MSGDVNHQSGREVEASDQQSTTHSAGREPSHGDIQDASAESENVSASEGVGRVEERVPDEDSDVDTWTIEGENKTLTVSRESPIVVCGNNGAIHTAACRIVKSDEQGKPRYAFECQIQERAECEFCKRIHGDSDGASENRGDNGKLGLRRNMDDIDTSDIFDSDTSEGSDDYIWSDDL